jgi:hypothetical protein
MFAFLAGMTERIGFATGILVLPQRQTALVARQAADVDLLSGGRLRLGVGVGWSHVEYEALGQDFRSRSRQEEHIELLRQLFTKPVVDFSAGSPGLIELHSCRSRRGRSRSGLVDLARRRSTGPPGSGTASSSLVAASTTPSRPGSGCGIECVGTAGRSRTSGDYVVLHSGGIGDLTAEIDAWRDAGGTHVSVVTMGRGLDSVDDHIDFLASLAHALVRA